MRDIPTDPPQYGNPKPHKDGWWHKHPDGSDWIHQSGKPCTDVTLQEWVIAGFSGAEPVKHIIYEKKTRPRSWFEKAEPYHIAVLTENAVDLLLGAAADIGTADISTLHVGIYELKDKPGMLELNAWVEVTER